MIRWKERDPDAKDMGFDTPIGAVLGEDGVLTVLSWRETADVAGWLESLSCAELFSEETAAALRRRLSPLAAAEGAELSLSSAVTYRLTDPARVNRGVILPSTRLFSPGDGWENLTECQPDPLGTGQLCFATVLDGRVVSAASENPSLGDVVDVGVETAAPYENRGFAASNVAALAAALLEKGSAVTYTVEDDNPVSRRVAEKVGFSVLSRDRWAVFTVAL